MPIEVPPPPSPNRPLALLGGLTPSQFLRRHWQKKPLLIRAALPGLEPLSRARLFALARQADVESRLVTHTAGGHWTLQHGPFERSAFPARDRPGWTLLVQGVDLHDDAAHALLQRFRFVPDARLDDLMVSWASSGGGVGPHFDSYDVFLLQAQGRRCWRISRQRDLRLEQGLPLKILKNFVAEEEFVLDPGDMLYVPPLWAHDGAAEGGECMTYSIGFQAPRRAVLAAEIGQRLAAVLEEDALYRDPQLEATSRPARIPRELQRFAAGAVERLLARPRAIARSLGELSTEPKPNVVFDEPETSWRPGAVVLDRRTRMMYDERSIFINGECRRVTGTDASLMRRLANDRRLEGPVVRTASPAARALLADWFRAGWLHRHR
jgi:50S ribosomal protein L16 3-hydroxylase